jgi:HlyD family secretion protein
MAGIKGRKISRGKLRVIILSVLVGGVLLWWLISSLVSGGNAGGDILTSGFIEAREVQVASEAGGRVVDIVVDEGDEVGVGEVVVRLDDAMLKAQLSEAEANLEFAVASLEQAVAVRDGTQMALENALEIRDNPQELELQIIQAEGEVERAESNYSAFGVPSARVGIDTARKVLEYLLEIKANPQELSAAVDSASTAYATALASVEAARGKVGQAEAHLELVRVQLDRLTLRSSLSGVVASRHVEVGEIARAGSSILTVTEIREVTLTAYVPESKIGLVKLGQEVWVTVDSYPEEVFTGKVTYISPGALFTPKNVQLKEEREKMVFSVKIRLLNPEQKLKPGMPADAQIRVGLDK